MSGITGTECCDGTNGTYDLKNTGNCTWVRLLQPLTSISLVKDGDTCTMSIFIRDLACNAVGFNYFYATITFTAGNCCDLDETVAIDSVLGEDSCNISGATVRVQAICTVECDECNDNEGPAEFQLNVSGWGDGSFCSDCDEALNGTFVLFQLGPGCTWISNYFTFCGDAFCHWQLALNSGVLTVSLVNGIGAQLWKWTWTHDGDCLNWTSVALTHSYSDPTYSGYCFGVGAVDVTAL